MESSPRPLTVQRLEAVEAAAARCFAGGEGIPALGGFAAFAGAGSPLTHLCGGGVSGPCRAADLAAVEAFYSERGCDTVLELSPMMDATLLDLLPERGYRFTQFENSLVATLAAPPPEPPFAIREVVSSEAGAWSHLLARGFFGRDEVSPDEAAIGQPIAKHARAYTVELAGTPVATAALWMEDEIACLMADSTLLAHRGQGIQRALIEHRLRDAIAAGARHAMATTTPNSLSQANYLRCGFRVLYTKVTAVRQLRSRPD